MTAEVGGGAEPGTLAAGGRRGAGALRDDGGEVVVGDDLLAVGVRDHGAVDVVQLVALERVAELLAAALHRVAAGVLAEHERRA